MLLELAFYPGTFLSLWLMRCQGPAQPIGAGDLSHRQDPMFQGRSRTATASVIPGKVASMLSASLLAPTPLMFCAVFSLDPIKICL